MLTGKSLRSSRKFPFPSFIKEHIVFKEFNEFPKIFPKIGLPNCSLPISKLELKPLRASWKDLEATGDIIYEAEQVAYTLSCKINKQASKSTELHADLKNLSKNFNRIDPEDFHSKNGKMSFPEKKLGFSREKILSLLNQAYSSIEVKIQDPFTFLEGRPDLDKSYKAVFASDGLSGAWDIATMSMRGIDSCQSWNGEYRKHLIGSIVDPYCGIIYLTKGTDCQKHGIKMLKRCVVRYVFDIGTHKPALFLERLYSSDNNLSKDMAKNIFASFLREKTSLPILCDVQDFEDEEEEGAFLGKVVEGSGYHIPASRALWCLTTAGGEDDEENIRHNENLSYIDSTLDYSNSSKNYSKTFPPVV